MSASPSWLSGDVETQAAHATRVKAEFGTNAEDADGPSDTRSLCNAHPVKAVVATVDVKFETVGAPGADVEVDMEANLTATVPRVIATEDKTVGINTVGINTVGIKNTVGINIAGVNTVGINETLEQ